jgi:hypothetical protein
VTDFLTTPQSLDSNNSIENNNNNLQNNSEEGTQPENTETDNGPGRRHSRKGNRRLANLNTTKAQKQKKMARLTSERDGKKADLDRGYINVQIGDDSERVKRVSLDSSDKEVIKSVIAEKSLEIYELGLDISEIDLKIRDLAIAKKSSYNNKLSKKKAGKTEDDLVKRVSKELDKASQSGNKEIVSQIQQDVQAGNKSDAYKSLKSFLSENVKTVSRKLSKSKELETKVLDRVLDKQTPTQ